MAAIDGAPIPLRKYVSDFLDDHVLFFKHTAMQPIVEFVKDRIDFEDDELSDWLDAVAEMEGYDDFPPLHLVGKLPRSMMVVNDHMLEGR